jgi:ATP-dependent Lhr-like helicase
LFIYLQDTLGAIAPSKLAKLPKIKKSTVLFCQSRALAEDIAERIMGPGGTDVFVVHHSSVSLEERAAAEERLIMVKASTSIVCTSTLELGIDVGGQIWFSNGIAPSTAVMLSVQWLASRPHGAGVHNNMRSLRFCENIEDSCCNRLRSR